MSDDDVTDDALVFALRLFVKRARPGRGRPSVEEFRQAVRDEARESSVLITDILRRNVALWRLEQQGFPKPTADQVAQTIALLSRPDGTASIAALRREIAGAASEITRRRQRKVSPRE